MGFRQRRDIITGETIYTNCTDPELAADIYWMLDSDEEILGLAAKLAIRMLDNGDCRGPERESGQTQSNPRGGKKTRVSKIICPNIQAQLARRAVDASIESVGITNAIE
jgi:hypothetical protein